MEDARTWVRTPKLKDKQVPNQEVPSRSGPAQWAMPKGRSAYSTVSYLVGKLEKHLQLAPPPTFSTQYRATSQHIRLIPIDKPRNSLQNLSRHMSIAKDTPTSPTLKLSTKSITKMLSINKGPWPRQESEHSSRKMLITKLESRALRGKIVGCGWFASLSGVCSSKLNSTVHSHKGFSEIALGFMGFYEIGLGVSSKLV
ncbi:unnamed protein product [Prunus armeniaca]